MNDFNDIIQKLIEFRKERDREQFHTPKNLAASISIESSELLEIFQWARHEKEIEKICIEKQIEIKEEIADILSYLFLLAKDLNIDIKDAMNNKIEKNKAKYPVEKSKGISTKYNEL